MRPLEEVLAEVEAARRLPPVVRRVTASMSVPLNSGEVRSPVPEGPCRVVGVGVRDVRDAAWPAIELAVMTEERSAVGYLAAMGSLSATRYDPCRVVDTVELGQMCRYVEGPSGVSWPAPAGSVRGRDVWGLSVMVDLLASTVAVWPLGVDGEPLGELWIDAPIDSSCFTTYGLSDPRWPGWDESLLSADDGFALVRELAGVDAVSRWGVAASSCDEVSTAIRSADLVFGCGDGLWWTLARSVRLRDRLGVAAQSDAPVGVLEKLSTDRDPLVRQRVLANSAAPPAVRSVLVAEFGEPEYRSLGIV